MNLPLPCIKCGYQPESAVPATIAREPANQPYAATSFTSSGHYGSTVWDPFSAGMFLEVNVCDKCLKIAGENGIVAVGHQRPPARQEIDYTPWDPDIRYD